MLADADDSAGRARVVFACVAENRSPWERRVATLAWSLRRYGGSLADAPFLACFVGGVDDHRAELVRREGAEVRVVEPIGERIPMANKLRMLELPEARDADVLVMIDCDTVVVGDLAPHLPADAVGAKPADTNPLRPEQWAALFDGLGLALPAGTFVATRTGRPMPRYFNSGVVTIPRAQLAPMRERWEHWTREVFALYERDPWVIPPIWHLMADQYSLMASLADGIPGAALPVAANCPTHTPIHRSVDLGGPPCVLHYHARADEHNLLQRAVDRRLERVMSRFNRERAAALGVPDPGLRPPPLRTRAHRELTRTVWRRYAGSRWYAALRTPATARRG